MNDWVQDFINKEYINLEFEIQQINNKFAKNIEQLRQLRKAVDNTMEASWLELLLVNLLGKDAGGVIYNQVVYSYKEYRGKIYWCKTFEYDSNLYCLKDENTSTDLYCLKDENTSTDLHS